MALKWAESAFPWRSGGGQFGAFFSKIGLKPFQKSFWRSVRGTSKAVLGTIEAGVGVQYK